jgi:hypothetical protein
MPNPITILFFSTLTTLGLAACVRQQLTRYVIPYVAHFAGGLFDSRNKCLDRRQSGENKTVYQIWRAYVCKETYSHTKSHKTASVCSNKYPITF